MVIVGVSFGLTLALAFYLDFRRMNLVQSGVLPKSTPQIFIPAFLGIIMDFSYVFSRQLTKSPDAATRILAPWLRAGVAVCGLAFALTLLSLFF